jgi:hypothetical protein
MLHSFTIFHHPNAGDRFNKSPFCFTKSAFLLGEITIVVQGGAPKIAKLVYNSNN